MKTSIYLFVTTLVIFTITGSCDKPLNKYNPDFEGTWRTATAYSDLYEKVITSEIVIKGKDGLYNYGCTDIIGCAPRLCNCITQQTGKAVINTSHTQMKIGSKNSYPVTINTEPYQDATGKWHMKVNDEEFVRE